MVQLYVKHYIKNGVIMRSNVSGVIIRKNHYILNGVILRKILHLKWCNHS